MQSVSRVHPFIMSMGAPQEGSNFSLFHIGEDELSFSEEDFFLPSIPSSSHVNNNNNKQGTSSGGTCGHNTDSSKTKNFQFTNRTPLQSSSLNNQGFEQRQSAPKAGTSQHRIGGLGVEGHGHRNQSNRITRTAPECEPPRKLAKFDQPPIGQGRSSHNGGSAVASSPRQFRFKHVPGKTGSCNQGPTTTSISGQTNFKQISDNSVALRPTGTPLKDLSRFHTSTTQSSREQSPQNLKKPLSYTSTNMPGTGPQIPATANEQRGPRMMARTVSSQFSKSPVPGSVGPSQKLHSIPEINPNPMRRNSFPVSTPNQRNSPVQPARQQFTPSSVSSPSPTSSAMRTPTFQRTGSGQFTRPPQSANQHQSPRPNISPHQIAAQRPPLGSNHRQSVSPAALPNQNMLTGQRAVTPQTPLLTSRIAQLCQTPVTSGSGTAKSKTRKFPGPAGLLPRLTSGQRVTEADLSAAPKKEENGSGNKLNDSVVHVVASSQDTEDEFGRGAWMNMKLDMGLDEKDPHCILSQCNIAMVMRKASLKQLPKGKVPHLCVLIKSVNFCDASAVFRDPSGEMQGTLHKKLLEEHQSDLKPGAALVLRQVSVLSPCLRNHYLNVTPSNLIQVYSAVDCNASLSSSQTVPVTAVETSRGPASSSEDRSGWIRDKQPQANEQSGNSVRHCGESEVQSERQGMFVQVPGRPPVRHGPRDGIVPADFTVTGKSGKQNRLPVKQQNNNNEHNASSSASVACPNDNGGVETKSGNLACEKTADVFETENLDALLEGIEEDELFADF